MLPDNITYIQILSDIHPSSQSLGNKNYWGWFPQTEGESQQKMRVHFLQMADTFVCSFIRHHNCFHVFGSSSDELGHPSLDFNRIEPYGNWVTFTFQRHGKTAKPLAKHPIRDAIQWYAVWPDAFLMEKLKGTAGSKNPAHSCMHETVEARSFQDICNDMLWHYSLAPQRWDQEVKVNWIGRTVQKEHVLHSMSRNVSHCGKPMPVTSEWGLLSFPPLSGPSKVPVLK